MDIVYSAYSLRQLRRLRRKVVRNLERSHYWQLVRGKRPDGEDAGERQLQQPPSRRSLRAAGPRGRLADTAYSSLRQEIENGELPPGSVLYELELVDRLTMSRTPVREALHRLCTEGYIAQQYRGYLVVELTDRDLANVYRVRGMLEGMAARQAADARSRVDIAILQDFIDKAEAAIQEAARGTSADFAEQFHDALAKASGNAYLHATLLDTRRYVEPYRIAH